MRQGRRHGAGVAATAVAGVVLGTAFGPSLATAGVETAKQVFVLNDEDSEAIATRAVGTTKVEVTGTDTSPVTVRPVAPAVTPVAKQLLWSFTGSSSAVASYDVPVEGGGMTIDFITAEDLGRTVGFEEFAVRATTGGEEVTHSLLTNRQGEKADVVSQSVRIVADPGTEVLFGLKLDAPLGGDGVTASMPGSFTGTLTRVAP